MYTLTSAPSTSYKQRFAYRRIQWRVKSEFETVPSWFLAGLPPLDMTFRGPPAWYRFVFGDGVEVMLQEGAPCFGISISLIHDSGEYCRLQFILSSSWGFCHFADLLRIAEMCWNYLIVRIFPTSNSQYKAFFLPFNIQKNRSVLSQTHSH